MTKGIAEVKTRRERKGSKITGLWWWQVSLLLAVALGVLRDLNGALQAANHRAEQAVASLALDGSSCNLHTRLPCNHSSKRRASVPAVTLETPGDTVASEELETGRKKHHHIRVAQGWLFVLPLPANSGQNLKVPPLSRGEQVGWAKIVKIASERRFECVRAAV